MLEKKCQFNIEISEDFKQQVRSYCVINGNISQKTFFEIAAENQFKKDLKEPRKKVILRPRTKLLKNR